MRRAGRRAAGRRPGRHQEGAPRSSILASSLSLRYGADEPWAFRNIGFEMAPCTCVAIDGPSGCGKSSVMRILMGLLSASDGNVLIDGRDIKAVGAAAYRKRIAGVM